MRKPFSPLKCLLPALLLPLACNEPGEIIRSDPRWKAGDDTESKEADTSEKEDTDQTHDSVVDSKDSGEDTDSGEDLLVVIAPDWLNLRQTPEGPVLLALPCASVVTLLGEPEEGWEHVSFEGVEGWVSGAWTLPPDKATGDLCPGPAPFTEDIPGRLVELLDVPPYVEQDCRDTEWEGWPFEALRCDYNGGLRVTVADPSAELVAAWIVDASQMIDALWSLRERDRGAWKDGLDVLATYTLYQSSRIFPLEGEIDEGTIYDFDRGVTVGCSTGCYCRINSLTRQQWCEYADRVLGVVRESDCLDEYTTDTFTDEWAEHCLDAHRSAWTSIHHHYRAQAWWANQILSDAFPDPDSADGDEVVSMLESLFL